MIASILDAAFAGLNTGGVAFFQVPTYGGQNYSFIMEHYLNRLGDNGMEMHAIEQDAVFKIAARHGARPIEVSADNYTGGVGVSTTFLFRKE